MKKLFTLVVVAIFLAACGGSVQENKTESTTDSTVTKTETVNPQNEVKTEVKTPDGPSDEGTFEGMKGTTLTLKRANGEMYYYQTSVKVDETVIKKGDKIKVYYKTEKVYNEQAGEKVDTYVVFQVDKL